METLKTILVDDERLARRSLRALLAAHPQIEIVGEAASAQQAKSQIESLQPGAAFVDVQMPGGSGFDLIEALRDPPAIVFVTAYDEYAVRAFEVNAVDYLLKPVEPDRLATAVARLRDMGVGAYETGGPYHADDEVLIKTTGRSFFLPVAKIAAIRAAGNYSYVISVQGEEYLVRRSLSDWEATLPADRFLGLDRSLLIHWQHIARWVMRGRKVELYLGRVAQPLELGRAAAQRFKADVIPRIESGSAPGGSASGRK